MVSEEDESMEFDKIDCFKSYLSRTDINDEFIEFNSFNSSIECNNTIKAEAEQFYNNLSIIIESDQIAMNCKECEECMMKFIKDFKVSDIALKDKTFNNSDSILNNDVKVFLLKLSYFVCYPNDLLTILFEIDFEIGHWNGKSFKIIKKELCLFWRRLPLFDMVERSFSISGCKKVLDEGLDQRNEPIKSIVDQLLLRMFSQEDPDETQALATIKSCLMTKFEEKGYIDSSTDYIKINKQECNNVYNPIQEPPKMNLIMMFVAKLAQCFLYDIVDEDFLYESFYHIMQPEFIAAKDKKAAEKEVIRFVKTTLKNYIHCLVKVEWKIETILTAYKHGPYIMNILSNSLKDEQQQRIT